MKKTITILICIVLCLTCIAGFTTDTQKLKKSTYKNLNKFPGVTMNIKQDSVTPTGITVVFKNNAKKQCIYGEFFNLEIKVGKTWYQVPDTLKGNNAFTTIGYMLNANSRLETQVNWKWLYGSLAKGQYRIVKDISDFRKPGNYDKYLMAAEFTIE